MSTDKRPANVRRSLIAFVASIGIGVPVAVAVLTGCGGGAQTQPAAQDGNTGAARQAASLTPCEQNYGSMYLDLEKVAEEGRGTPSEIAEVEETAEKGMKAARRVCASQRKEKVAAGELCSHTPAEMVALGNDKGSLEARAAYEVECGKQVP